MNKTELVEAVAKEWGATEDDKIEDGIYMKAQRFSKFYETEE